MSKSFHTSKPLRSSPRPHSSSIFQNREGYCEVLTTNVQWKFRKFMFDPSMIQLLHWRDLKIVNPMGQSHVHLDRESRRRLGERLRRELDLFKHDRKTGSSLYRQWKGEYSAMIRHVHKSKDQQNARIIATSMRTLLYILLYVIPMYRRGMHVSSLPPCPSQLSFSPSLETVRQGRQSFLPNTRQKTSL